MNGPSKALIACLAAVVPAASLAADPKPCEVLTLADVQGALGRGWKRNDAFSAGETCAYQGQPTAVVTIILTYDSTGAATILAGRQKLIGDKAKPAPGPGAGAYRVTTPRTIAIAFGKGDYVAQIEATPGATQDWTVLDKLAATVYRRLP